MQHETELGKRLVFLPILDCPTCTFRDNPVCRIMVGIDANNCDYKKYTHSQLLLVGNKKGIKKKKP